VGAPLSNYDIAAGQVYAASGGDKVYEPWLYYFGVDFALFGDEAKLAHALNKGTELRIKGVLAAYHDVIFVLRVLHGASYAFECGAVGWAGKFVVGAAAVAALGAGKGTFGINLQSDKHWLGAVFAGHIAQNAALVGTHRVAVVTNA
jgi:hypothetical protein